MLKEMQGKRIIQDLSDPTKLGFLDAQLCVLPFKTKGFF
jgi:hypothetical protein